MPIELAIKSVVLEGIEAISRIDLQNVCLTLDLNLQEGKEACMAAANQRELLVRSDEPAVRVRNLIQEMLNAQSQAT